MTGPWLFARLLPGDKAKPTSRDYDYALSKLLHATGHMRPSGATCEVVRRNTWTGPAAFGLKNSKRRRT